MYVIKDEFDYFEEKLAKSLKIFCRKGQIGIRIRIRIWYSYLLIPHSTRPKVSDPTGFLFVHLAKYSLSPCSQKSAVLLIKDFLFIRDLKTTRAVIPAVRRRRGRSAPPANQLITAVRSKRTFSVSVPSQFLWAPGVRQLFR
jgi:hypothetical protein